MQNCREKVLDNMSKNGHITQSEYDEAMADDVYSRIQSISLETSTSSPYSYFVDELIDEILNDLMEQKGYTQTQAYNVITEWRFKYIYHTRYSYSEYL